MEHELKIFPQYFCRVEDGSKTFEVRKNDRGFQFGDTVVLKEWDPKEGKQIPNHPFWKYMHEFWMGPKGYTGRFLRFRIGYVLPIDDERVVFSLLMEEA